MSDIIDNTNTIDDVELYRTHIVHYFDNQINNDILNLIEEDKIRFYEMLEQYADLFEKIFHKGIPIVEYILHNDQFKSAKEDPHDGIDWTECEIVKDYEKWKSTKG
jgi:hypothetical protein